MLALLVWLTFPSQEGDPGFNPAVDEPAYPTLHPRVYFDAGHWNVHKADERCQPFAQLLRRDGYEIVSGTAELREEKLQGIQLLLVANALGVSWSGTAAD
jgi:hypothetical protein